MSQTDPTSITSEGPTPPAPVEPADLTSEEGTAEEESQEAPGEVRTVRGLTSLVRP